MACAPGLQGTSGSQHRPGCMFEGIRESSGKLHSFHYCFQREPWLWGWEGRHGEGSPTQNRARGFSGPSLLRRGGACPVSPAQELGTS